MAWRNSPRRGPRRTPENTSGRSQNPETRGLGASRIRPFRRMTSSVRSFRTDRRLLPRRRQVLLNAAPLSLAFSRYRASCTQGIARKAHDRTKFHHGLIPSPWMTPGSIIESLSLQHLHERRLLDASPRGERFHQLQRAAARRRCSRPRRRCSLPRRPAPGWTRNRAGNRLHALRRSGERPSAGCAPASSIPGRSIATAPRSRTPPRDPRRGESAPGSAR